MIENRFDDFFSRTRLLVGDNAMDKLSRAKIIIFGLGGVGGWCVESLMRSGVQNITIVDSDIIEATNINRQIMATQSTIGRPKTTELKKRLLEINPLAQITEINKRWEESTKYEFNLSDFDYIIDCIDSLKNKILLATEATKTDAKLFSSMGSAFRLDSSKISVAEFWEVKGCRLGAMMRKRMRQRKVYPSKKFLCVFSEEIETKESMTSLTENASIMYITAAFGLKLSELVIKDIIKD